jgi:hypothetical protein
MIKPIDKNYLMEIKEMVAMMVIEKKQGSIIKYTLLSLRK